jgi:hypothetical protein
VARCIPIRYTPLLYGLVLPMVPVFLYLNTVSGYGYNKRFGVIIFLPFPVYFVIAHGYGALPCLEWTKYPINAI